MRLQLRHRQQIGPVVLDVGLLLHGHGQAGQIRRGEILCLQPIAEHGTRYGYREAVGQVGPLRIADGDARKLLPDAVERRDRTQRLAVIVTFERDQQVGRGTHHGDGLHARLERQHAGVLQQYHRLFGCAQGCSTVCVRGNLTWGHTAQGRGAGGVKHAELHPSREQPLRRTR